MTLNHSAHRHIQFVRLLSYNYKVLRTYTNHSRAGSCFLHVSTHFFLHWSPWILFKWSPNESVTLPPFSLKYFYKAEVSWYFHKGRVWMLFHDSVHNDSFPLTAPVYQTLFVHREWSWEACYEPLYPEAIMVTVVHCRYSALDSLVTPKVPFPMAAQWAPRTVA